LLLPDEHRFLTISFTFLFICPLPIVCSLVFCGRTAYFFSFSCVFLSLICFFHASLRAAGGRITFPHRGSPLALIFMRREDGFLSPFHFSPFPPNNSFSLSSGSLLAPFIPGVGVGRGFPFVKVLPHPDGDLIRTWPFIPPSFGFGLPVPLARATCRRSPPSWKINSATYSFVPSHVFSWLFPVQGVPRHSLLSF